MKRNLIFKTILNAVGADGAGTPINIANYTNKEITLDSDGGGNAALVVKFQISYQNDVPDFNAAQATNNQWEYCAVRDRQDNSVIAGDTGITFSSADDHRVFNLETNCAIWVNAIISNWTAGEITVKIRMANQ